MRNVSVPLCLSFLLAVCAASSAAAQESVFKAAIGGMALVAPDYEGSDDYRVRALPLIDMTYGEHFFVHTRRGIGWRVAPDSRQWDASIALGYRFGRKESDNQALQGLGDVRGGAELVVAASYLLAPLTLSVEARHQVNDSNGGTVLELKSAYRIPCPHERVFSALTPSVTWANREYMASRFGITAAQSLRSGYAPFQADAGIKDVGVAWTLQYSVTPSVTLSSLISYSRLVGDAAQSPMVRLEGSADQMRGGVGVAYRF
ncbi:MipA/OmpV family protein [Chrysiogenes arsenatis]|uniref:MipA/OmpV family protein n=1 Tax=Chrysiogenes arsenatis TaxID=309797 RepID=UPI00042788D1|nr:MipA/OmpV family protein [Chrysiogenes arsenatis]